MHRQQKLFADSTGVIVAGAATAPRRDTRWVLAAVVLMVTGSVVSVSAPGVAAADDWLYRPTSGVFAVQGHGEGHGRGMSQYGAQGAAAAGLSSAQILDFYYPGTVSTQLDPGQPLKVWISADSDGVTEVLQSPDLVVTDAGNGARVNLPAGTDRVRTVVGGGGLVVQARVGGAWGAVTGVAGPEIVFRADAVGTVDVVLPSGHRIGYRGSVSAVRKDGSSVTVNTVRLDDYVRGVVPRESPSSWRPAALQSQAVAARSFAAVSFRSPRDSRYQICDDANCQVYGGATFDGATREAASTDAATSATAGLVRTYNGSVINAQFGSTNGGWTVDGRVPYLPAQADPYEARANPPQAYANWKGTLAVSSLESRFRSIGSFTRMRISQRDGNGEWGGRVISAVIEGTAGSQSVTGDQLRQALTADVRSTYFQLTDSARAEVPQGSLDDAAVYGTVVSVRGWVFDPSDPRAATTVHLYDTDVAGNTRIVPAVAASSRPDVGAALPAAGPDHGFAAGWVTSGRGVHRICAYGINIGVGDSNPLLGCRTVVVADVLGNVEAVTGSVGQATVTGWTIDPAAPDRSTGVLVYDYLPDRRSGYGGFAAVANRPDVAAAYPGSGPAHGFTATIPITAEGRHQLCVYASPVRAGDPTTTVGCRTLDVVNPIGHLDAVRLEDGFIRAEGWAVDPTAAAERPVEVHLYVSGGGTVRTYTGVRADQPRTDIGAAYPAAGDRHGFSAKVPGNSAGPTTVCAYAISVGASVDNPWLGCETIVMP